MIDRDHDYGFPMSKLVHETGLRLGPRAMNLASQAMYRYTEQAEEDLNAFVRHHFRAILQVIIAERGWYTGPNPEKFFAVGTLPKECFSSVEVYLATCLDKFGFGHRLTKEELHAYGEKFTGLEGLLAFCWTLRALMSQVLESLVLLDRLLFLEESEGVTATLFPIFDPFESPRNMVLVATKREK